MYFLAFINKVSHSEVQESLHDLFRWIQTACIYVGTSCSLSIKNIIIILFIFFYSCVVFLAFKFLYLDIVSKCIYQLYIVKNLAFDYEYSKGQS